MGDLILETRIAVLEASLEKVRQILGGCNKRQGLLKEVINKLEVCRNDGDTRAKALTIYLRDQQEYAAEDKKRTPELDKAIEDALRLRELHGRGGELAELRNTIKALSETCTEIRLRDRATESQKEFEKKAKDLLKSLRKETDWRNYERVRLEAEPLLTEFSEFLAGLALRDSGFDEGICEIAEDLLKSCVTGRSREEPLTMPIPHEVVAILSNTVGLTYPEWTLWSLPMAAYEFWGVYAMRQNEIRTGFKELFKRASFDHKKFSFKRPRSLLADAFATYSMGPAYACYAFQLSLSPVGATRGGKASKIEPLPSERAEIILEMLDRMDQKLPRAWSPIIDELRQSWNKAVEAANPGAAPLAPEVRNALKNAVSIMAETLHSETRVEFSVEYWPRVEVCAEALRDDKLSEDSADPVIEMRDIVNAAWRARSWISDRKQIADIAARATQLRDSILKKRDQGAKKPDTPLLFPRPF